MINQAIWVSIEGDFGGSIRMCPPSSYISIDQLKNPVHLNIVQSMCLVNATRSCCFLEGEQWTLISLFL